MKKNYKINNSIKLTSYSTMAAALVGMVNTAEAEVIYNDIPDFTVELETEYDIDIDGDGVLDFRFRAGTASSGSWTFASIFGSVPADLVGNSSNQLIGYKGEFSYYGSALDAGESIGPEGPWLDYPSYGNNAVLASNYFGDTYGQFPGKGEKFIGMKFLIGSNLHYGWIRVEADISPAHVTIIDYAYDGTPNFPIEAGATTGGGVGINESSTGINIYSFESSIFINNVNNVDVKSVKIYDITGNIIYDKSIMQNNDRIDLDQYASGNYFINLDTELGIVNKKIFIQ